MAVWLRSAAHSDKADRLRGSFWPARATAPADWIGGPAAAIDALRIRSERLELSHLRRRCSVSCSRASSIRRHAPRPDRSRRALCGWCPAAATPAPGDRASRLSAVGGAPSPRGTPAGSAAPSTALRSQAPHICNCSHPVALGFEICPVCGRQGYPRQACRARMAWAHRCDHGAEVVLSIAADTAPALRLAQAQAL